MVTGVSFILAVVALAVPPNRDDIDVVVAAANYLGAFLIAGAVLRQLTRDLTYIVPGVCVIAYLFLVYLGAQAAPSHGRLLTYLGLLVAVAAAPALVVFVVAIWTGFVWVSRKVHRLGSAAVARVASFAQAHQPLSRVRLAADASAEPEAPLFPPTKGIDERRLVVYVGVASLTYGLILTLRKRYLDF